MSKHLYAERQLWKAWLGRLLFVAFVLLLASCRSKKPDPEIKGFIFYPDGPEFAPATEIGIQVDVVPNGHTIGYEWWLDEEGGAITGKREAPLITYITPVEPGPYRVSIGIKYEENGYITDTTTITISDKLAVVPTETPDVTETPALTPALTFTPEVSATSEITITAQALTRTPTLTLTLPTEELPSSPSPTPTATATPTPTPRATAIPTPIAVSPTPKPVPADARPSVELQSPADDASFYGRDQRVELKWKADKKLSEELYYFIDARFRGVDENGVCRGDWLYFKWTKEESHVLDTWLYDVMCPAPEERTIRWTVYVGSPAQSLEDSSASTLSAVADARRDLQWRIQGTERGSVSGGGGDINYDPNPPID
jgi:hypothetical protein